MTLCVLEQRACNNCRECDVCDIDPKKKCTNCCACIDTDKGVARTIIIKKEPLETEGKPERKVIKWAPRKNDAEK